MVRFIDFEGAEGLDGGYAVGRFPFECADAVELFLLPSLGDGGELSSRRSHSVGIDEFLKPRI